MSYTFYSFRDRSQQNDEQWATRSVEGEIKSSLTRSLVEIFDNHLKNSKSRVVEAGCGLGGWIPFFQERGHDIIGIEYESEIVRRVKAYDKTLPIMQGDICDLDFPDEYFDEYISLGVIEHFEEGPQKALQEAWRVLKPGGLAFITVPYLNLFRRFLVHPLRDLYFFIGRLKGEKDYFWEYRYTKRELGGFLIGSGFEIIQTAIDDYVTGDTHHHIGLYADFFFLRKKKGDIWELNYLGRLLLKVSRFFSPWLVCSGLHMVARKKQ